MVVAERSANRIPPIVIVLAVVLLFAGILLAKAMTDNGAAEDSSTGSPTKTASSAAGSITSVRNDATADYEAALRGGKPIFVLFHSLTCQPCVEISAVVDEVMPEYEGRVAFVNAITDDESSQRLAEGFSFQYIPSSFFLAPDGTVVDSFTGAMDESAMKVRLDGLIAK